MMLTDLADIASGAGLTVVEVPGWQRRGRPFPDRPGAIICHHTAGPTQQAARGRDYPSLAVVRDGRPGIPGPLCQLGIGYSGTIYIVAAGVANHAGKVGHPDHGNRRTIGIEAEHPGRGDWPAVQMDAYRRLVQAIQAAYHIPTERVLGHKEVAVPKGRKNDPSFDMTQFRADLATPTKQPVPEEYDMIRHGDRGHHVAQLQRTINGINARTARLGAEPVDPIPVDGIYGDQTAHALNHAHQRAQHLLGLDWAGDWSPREVGPLDMAMLLQAVVRAGDQLKAA